MTSRKQLARIAQFSHKAINVDVLSGWESGMKSARALWPEHLTGSRWADWMAGRDAARRYLATRRTFFYGHKPNGEAVEVVRKGWVARGPIVSQMARSGVTGDVFVSYIDAAKDSAPRTVRCGI